MKTKKLLIIIGLIIFISSSLIIIFLLNKKQNDYEIIIYNKDFIYMENTSYDLEDNEPFIIENYKKYQELFDSDKLNKEDFIKNNYVYIPVLFDSCSEEELTPSDYNLTKDKIIITFKYKSKCGVCAPKYVRYLLTVDKDIITNNIEIKYNSINKPVCDPNISYKPLIYIYPLEDTNVEVILGNSKLLTTTYPKYQNGWKMLARVDGSLVDCTGRSYYGLYWEGKNYIEDNFKDGFIVEKEDTIDFLEEKLKILGLKEREINEFIIFWLPKLEENEYNLIRFLDINSINKQMSLNINPTPDTIIRIFMLYKPLKNKITIKEQKLTQVIRHGYTVVEWGGSLIK